MAYAESEWIGPGHVYDNGHEYSFSLLLDYEKYIETFDYVSLIEFLKGWTCITRYCFENLEIDNIIYSATGQKYRVISTPCYDEYNEPWVKAVEIDKNGTEREYPESIYAGTAYSREVPHVNYLYKNRIIREGDKPICPILITKTKTPQN